MDPIKVVVRYANGSIVKGYTQNFLPNKSVFHIRPHDSAVATDAVEIRTDDLKAVFFVKDFTGNKQYKEKKHLDEGERRPGRLIEVTFRDGEILRGTTTGYDPNRPGFFLFPLDPKENNVRVYVVSRAVVKARYI